MEEKFKIKLRACSATSDPKTSGVLKTGIPYFLAAILSILSTPKGVMSDNQAKKNNVGGEILCEVF